MSTLYSTWKEALAANPDNETSNNDLAGLVELFAPNRTPDDVFDALVGDETLVLLARKFGGGWDAEMSLLHHFEKFEASIQDGRPYPLWVSLCGGGHDGNPVALPFPHLLQVVQVMAPDWNILRTLDCKEKMLVTNLLDGDKTLYFLRHVQVVPPFLHQAMLACPVQSPAALLVECVRAIRTYDAAREASTGKDDKLAEKYCQGIVAYLWVVAQTETPIQIVPLQHISPEDAQVKEWSDLIHKVYIKPPEPPTLAVAASMNFQPSSAAIPPPAATATATNEIPRLPPMNFEGAVEASVNVDNSNTDGLKKRSSKRTWDESFQLLLEFKEKNGTCWVRQRDEENKALATWVKHQRQKKKILTPEQIARLDAIGFLWSNPQQGKLDEDWNVMYERLKQYQQIYGNTKVPKQWEVDKDLAEWVFRQKDLFREDRLQEDRYNKLDAIGFDFKIRHKSREKSLAISDKYWAKHFQNLVAFKEKHGHTMVPTTLGKYEDKKLSRFVVTQRKLLRRNQMREDRKQKLDEIDFVWEPKEYQWNKWYNVLKKFKEKHGHLRIPKTFEKAAAQAGYKANNKQSTDHADLSEKRKKAMEAQAIRITNKNMLVPESEEEIGLYDWAYTQRIQFQRGQIYEERQKMLEDLGFEFQPQSRRGLNLKRKPSGEGESTGDDDEAAIYLSPPTKLPGVEDGDDENDDDIEEDEDDDEEDDEMDEEDDQGPVLAQI